VGLLRPSIRSQRTDRTSRIPGHGLIETLSDKTDTDIVVQVRRTEGHEKGNPQSFSAVYVRKSGRVGDDGICYEGTVCCGAGLMTGRPASGYHLGSNLKLIVANARGTVIPPSAFSVSSLYLR
jgi:hypothetical protein